MNELQQLLALLGVSSFAEASSALANFNAFLGEAKASTGKTATAEALVVIKARSSFASAVETATGKTGDEAVGLIRAALTSHAEIGPLKERVAEVEKANDAAKLDGFIAKAKTENKITPVIEQNIRAAVTAGDVTLKGAESWLANLTAIPALANRQEAAPTGSGGGQAQTWNGKAYADLKPLERVELKRKDPALFEAMRATTAA